MVSIFSFDFPMMLQKNTSFIILSTLELSKSNPVSHVPMIDCNDVI